MKGKCQNISAVSESFQDSVPSKSLVLPGSAREGNFTKLQRSHHEKTMSLLDGVFSTEGEILHNDFSGYFES